jgi:hypothetical protein
VTGNSRADFRWTWLDLVDADRTLSRNAHHAAYTLARKYANRRTLQAYPSQLELARTMRSSRRLVSDALHELVEYGFLDVRRGHPASGRGYVYTLRAPDLNAPFQRIRRGALQR